MTVMHVGPSKLGPTQTYASYWVLVLGLSSWTTLSQVQVVRLCEFTRTITMGQNHIAKFHKHTSFTPIATTSFITMWGMSIDWPSCMYRV